MYTYIHTYIHTYVRTYVRTYVCTYVKTRVLIRRGALRAHCHSFVALRGSADRRRITTITISITISITIIITIVGERGLRKK